MILLVNTLMLISVIFIMLGVKNRADKKIMLPVATATALCSLIFFLMNFNSMNNGDQELSTALTWAPVFVIILSLSVFFGIFANFKVKQRNRRF